ncbi:MAG: hypothetical protein JO291_15275 [Acidimicrobiia bacterium]|nr:hypothetical protein [Acidimicrobiia bacterium]
MRFLIRASIASALLFVVAGCGITGDKVADDTSSSATTTTTEKHRSTTTTEHESSSTTDGGSGLDENDPELSDLLLTGDDFGTGLEASPDPDPGFDPEICKGHRYTVLPVKQATVDFQTSDENNFVTEGIAEFDSDDDASQFLADLQTLNDKCKEDAADDAVPGTFEPVDDLGDEAVRVDPDLGTDPFELIVARADDRIILLASFGDEQFLTNAVVAEAVDRATP